MVASWCSIYDCFKEVCILDLQRLDGVSIFFVSVRNPQLFKHYIRKRKRGIGQRWSPMVA